MTTLSKNYFPAFSFWLFALLVIAAILFSLLMPRQTASQSIDTAETRTTTIQAADVAEKQ